MRIVIDMQGMQAEVYGHQNEYQSAMNVVKAFLGMKKDGDEFFLALDGSSEDSCRALREEFYGLLPQKNIKVWNWYPEASPAYTNPGGGRAAAYFHEWFLHQLKADIIWDFFIQKDWLEIENAPKAGNAGGSEFRFGMLCEKSPFDFDSVIEYCRKCDGLFVASASLKKQLAARTGRNEKDILSVNGGDCKKAASEIYSFLALRGHKDSTRGAFPCTSCLQGFKDFQSLPDDAAFIHKMALSFCDSRIPRRKRLYVDVTDCLDIERVTGIQRVEYSI